MHIRSTFGQTKVIRDSEPRDSAPGRTPGFTNFYWVSIPTRVAAAPLYTHAMQSMEQDNADVPAQPEVGRLPGLPDLAPLPEAAKVLTVVTQFDHRIGPDTATLLLIEKLRVQRERILQRLERIEEELQEQITKVNTEETGLEDIRRER